MFSAKSQQNHGADRLASLFASMHHIDNSIYGATSVMFSTDRFKKTLYLSFVNIRFISSLTYWIQALHYGIKNHLVFDHSTLYGHARTFGFHVLYDSGGTYGHHEWRILLLQRVKQFLGIHGAAIHPPNAAFWPG